MILKNPHNCWVCTGWKTGHIMDIEYNHRIHKIVGMALRTMKNAGTTIDSEVLYLNGFRKGGFYGLG